METGKTILLISSCKIKELEDTFNKLYMQRGCVFETVYAASRYHGPVFIVDLRVDKLCTLGIDPKRDVVNDLYKMFQCCVIIYEQMNTLILCDEEDKCLFYSGNQICKLLNGSTPWRNRKDTQRDLSWMNVFPSARIFAKMPENAQGNYNHALWYQEQGDSFACMELKDIPEMYRRFDEEIYGVENYLPRLIYDIMEGIKNKHYPWIVYPPQYKPVEERIYGMYMKMMYWHEGKECLGWFMNESRYIPPSSPVAGY